MTHFVGWDVAGWRCPSTPQTGPVRKSQDALVVLGKQNGRLAHIATRVGNFRREILDGTDLVRKLVGQPSGGSGDDVILAIDAPLGWPEAFQKLLSWSWNGSSHANLLYRDTDTRHGGQSAVVRSVGTASTKALAYLQKQGFKPSQSKVGVFVQGTAEAIETYPKVVGNHAKADPHGSLAAEHARLMPQLACNTDDTEAALWCALIAAIWATALPNAPVLQPPPATLAPTEGWIWAP